LNGCVEPPFSGSVHPHDASFWKQALQPLSRSALCQSAAHREADIMVLRPLTMGAGPSEPAMSTGWVFDFSFPIRGGPPFQGVETLRLLCTTDVLPFLEGFLLFPPSPLLTADPQLVHRANNSPHMTSMRDENGFNRCFLLQIPNFLSTGPVYFEPCCLQVRNCFLKRIRRFPFDGVPQSGSPFAGGKVGSASPLNSDIQEPSFMTFLAFFNATRLSVHLRFPLS